MRTITASKQWIRNKMLKLKVGNDQLGNLGIY
jgi:hypothetical protein